MPDPWLGNGSGETFTLVRLDYHVYVCLIIDLHKLEFECFLALSILVGAWEEMCYYTVLHLDYSIYSPVIFCKISIRLLII